MAEDVSKELLPDECLFAWTSVGDYDYYPQFVNVSRKNGKIVVSVRSPESLKSSQAQCTLPDDEAENLARALTRAAPDVEKVARAICCAVGGDPDATIPDGSCAKIWEAHIPSAKAAIAAIEGGG